MVTNNVVKDRQIDWCRFRCRRRAGRDPEILFVNELVDVRQRVTESVVVSEVELFVRNRWTHVDSSRQKWSDGD